MSIEVGDVFRNEGEHVSCLVICADNPWGEGFEYRILCWHGNKDSRYHDLRWIPESILLSKHYVKIGHIDISLLAEEKEDDS